MAEVLLVTPSPDPDPFPALSLLPHIVTVRTPRDQVLTESAAADIVIIDARFDLVAARNLSQMFSSAGVGVPRLAILAEETLASYNRDWGCADFVLASAGPAEIEARLRGLVCLDEEVGKRLVVGGIVIDEAAYAVWLDDRPLDLTFTEFELLKYLATSPRQVFSREQLLTEVWGHDYFGGTRTVDVHIRRLRAKLGREYESLIGTVRNVGYRFNTR